MNRINSTEKELNEKIFDTLDNWMRENKIKNDADILKRISEKFPDCGIEQGRFSLLRNCKARIKLDEAIMIAECLGISIDRLLQRDIEPQDNDDDDNTAADVLKPIFDLHKIIDFSFTKHRIREDDGEIKDFTGIYFDNYIVVKKFRTFVEYFINDTLENWQKIIDSISSLPRSEQKKILQDWERSKLETAQDIFLDYPMYEYDFDTEKYKKSLPESRKTPDTN
jgi:hypothetical protein